MTDKKDSTELAKIDLAKIDRSITMILTYVKNVDVSGVIKVLEAIKKTPEDLSLINDLSDSLQPLGISQGAVLTYAPYITVLISDDPFGDD